MNGVTNKYGSVNINEKNTQQKLEELVQYAREKKIFLFAKFHLDNLKQPFPLVKLDFSNCKILKLEDKNCIQLTFTPNQKDNRSFIFYGAAGKHTDVSIELMTIAENKGEYKTLFKDGGFVISKGNNFDLDYNMVSELGRIFSKTTTVLEKQISMLEKDYVDVGEGTLFADAKRDVTFWSVHNHGAAKTRNKHHEYLHLSIKSSTDVKIVQVVNIKCLLNFDLIYNRIRNEMANRGIELAN